MANILANIEKTLPKVVDKVFAVDSLTERLTDMQNRIPSDSINNIILALTQANIYGSSIISTMYNQVDYLREKRKMEVKATISKIPTKISIISVFFFIPLILLIILGPAILSYIK